jgi:hypothetical protein
MTVTSKGSWSDQVGYMIYSVYSIQIRLKFIVQYEQFWNSTNIFCSMCYKSSHFAYITFNTVGSLMSKEVTD